MRPLSAMSLALLVLGTPGLVRAYPLPPGSEARAARYDEWRGRIDDAERAAAEGRWEAAASSFSAIVEEARALGDHSLLLARAVDGLAAARGREARLDEAARLYEESAVLLERLLGPDQPRLGVTLHNLGLVYDGLHRTEDARAAFGRALAIFERSLGADSGGASAARTALSRLGAPRQPEPALE